MPRALPSINDTTVPPEEPLGQTGPDSLFTTAVVILECVSEPHRAGEVAYLPQDGSRLYLGRGDEQPETRVAFHPQQPGKHPIAAPLRGRGLSRRAAWMELGPKGIVFERVGTSKMLVNGEHVEKGELVPDDLIRFPGELLLQCVARRRTMAPLEYFPAEALGDFGEPDAYDMIGESPEMRALREQLARDAASAVNILLRGESGTGKELAAKGIHALSDRRNRALVACNGGAIPPLLVSSEVFGNLRDYPNAGMPARIGYFATADKGILFVDEIIELPLDAQKALLRAFANGGEFNRVGESVARRADVRVIGATNGNPDDPTKMRGDLRARFSLIQIPPLRERREDIPLLVRHLAREHAKKCTAERRGRLFFEYRGRLEVKMDLESMERLVRMPLRHNVRQLGEILRLAIATSAGDCVVIEPGVGMGAAGDEAGAGSGESPADGGAKRPVRRVPARVYTAEEVVAALEKAGGNKTAAAEELGMDRWALDRLMKKLGIAK